MTYFEKSSLSLIFITIVALVIHPPVVTEPRMAFSIMWVAYLFIWSIFSFIKNKEELE